jgi:hypothetical protein
MPKLYGEKPRGFKDSEEILQQRRFEAAVFRRQFKVSVP